MPDVLRGEDHQSPRDEARILAGLDHPREPVQTGVDVGAADALDERRQYVVVLVVAVAQGAQRDRDLRVIERDEVASLSAASAAATSSDVSA